jgi:hypothetical protein
MSTADHGNTAAAHVLQIAQERRDGPLKSARRLSLSIVLAGVLALGASPTAGIAADLAVSEPAPRHIVTRWRVAKRVVASRCIEISQRPRGCPLRRDPRSLAWPRIVSLGVV